MRKPSLGSLVAPALVFALTLASCGEIAEETIELAGLDDWKWGSGSTTSSVVVSPSGRFVEVTEGAGPLVVKLRRVRPDDTELSVDFETRGGGTAMTATPGLDYYSNRGRLTWGPNDGSEKIVEVEIIDDQVFELQEVFTILFSGRVADTEIERRLVCVIRDRSAPPNFVADVATISARTGGAQFMQLRAGAVNNGRSYAVLGSMGTSPGFDVLGFHVPLNLDSWFRTTLDSFDAPAFYRFRGQLSESGSAIAAIRTPPLTDPNLIGLTLHHAYVVYDDTGVRMVSEPVALTIVP